ncbi:MAG: hypothetical protein FWF16_03915 [Microbacteriaceae bacterium]|nr:hypothetical protein [Microbacteriaceae bacterium]
MSTNRRPVGRRSAAVYRRRRLAVLVGLLAVVVLVVLLVTHPWQGAATPTGDRSPAASGHTPAPSPAASGTPAPSASGTPAPTTIPTVKASAAGDPCDPVNIDVQAITDAARYASTARPLLSLSLTNTGAQMCTIDAGTASMVFTITSGHEQYWTSTDCQTDPVHTVIKLEPHQTLTSVPIAWDRTRSSKTTCSAKTRTVAPGGGASYHLAVAVDGIASKTTKQFILD